MRPPGPPECPGEHDARRLHAMAPELIGQTIERVEGYKQGVPPSCQRQDPASCMWIIVIASLDDRPLTAVRLERVAYCFVRCGRRP
jgi:hypothetical protein